MVNGYVKESILNANTVVIRLRSHRFKLEELIHYGTHGLGAIIHNVILVVISIKDMGFV